MAEYFVSPTGLVGNLGTIASPWDLASALSGHSGAIQPGDTVWLRGGTYTQGPQWLQTTNGTFGANEDDITLWIKWRNYPGEFVSITNTNDPGDGNTDALVVDGTANAWWATVGQGEGIEIWRNVPTTRLLQGRGSSVYFRNVPQDNKLIHVVVRDGANGVFNGNGAGTDYRHHLELYGLISFNNGVDTSPRGHGLYLRHWRVAGRSLRVIGGVIFNQFGLGTQIFGSAGGDGVSDVDYTDTMVWGAGTLGTETGSGWSNFVNGGSGTTPARNNKINRNVFYQPRNLLVEAQVGIGSAGATNEDDEFLDNYIVGGGNGGLAALLGVQPHRVDGLASLKCERNFVSAHGGAARAINTNQAGSLALYTAWANNNLRFDPAVTNWRQVVTNKTFATWKTDTGLGATDTAAAGDPTVNKAFVIPVNKYNAGYAHVAIFNWEGGANVNVDLSSVLSNGDTYEIYHFYDFVPGSGFGVPLLSGTYNGGTLALPTTAHTPPAVNGTSPRSAPATDTFFNAFLVKRTGSGNSPPGGGLDFTRSNRKPTGASSSGSGASSSSSSF